jgi:hypothetical protein
VKLALLSMKNNHRLLGGRSDRVAETPSAVDTTGGLQNLNAGAITPPILGQIVGTNDDILSNKLMARPAVGGNNHGPGIDKIIKVLSLHTIAVHLIEEADSMIIVVVTPKASRLMRKNIITSLTLIKSEILTETTGGLRLTPARGPDKENSKRLFIVAARFGLNAAIFVSRLVIAQHLREMLFPQLVARTLSVNRGLKSYQIGAGALLGRAAELHARSGDRGIILLSAVINRLLLGTAARLQMKRVALGLKAVEHRKLEAAADRLGVLELKVTLEVVRALRADLLLANKVLNAAGEISFAESERRELGVVEREHVVASARHGGSLQEKNVRA